MLYRLNDDIEYPDRWYLGDVIGVDNWQLATSSPDTNEPLDVELVQDGVETDFTITATYGLPIVSSKIRREFVDLPELTFVPVSVVGRSCHTQYYVMVTKRTVDCVDEEKSEYQKFEENDPVRPDLAGEYRAFFELKVDPTKTAGLSIFRIAKFEVAIIVDERIKELLGGIDATGFTLSPV